MRATARRWRSCEDGGGWERRLSQSSRSGFSSAIEAAASGQDGLTLFTDEDIVELLTE